MLSQMLLDSYLWAPSQDLMGLEDTKLETMDGKDKAVAYNVLLVKNIVSRNPWSPTLTPVFSKSHQNLIFKMKRRFNTQEFNLLWNHWHMQMLVPVKLNKITCQMTYTSVTCHKLIQ